MWISNAKFITSGTIIPFDLEGQPTYCRNRVMFFYCLEDAMHETESRNNRYPERKKEQAD